MHECIKIQLINRTTWINRTGQAGAGLHEAEVARPTFKREERQLIDAYGYSTFFIKRNKTGKCTELSHKYGALNVHTDFDEGPIVVR